MNPEEKVIIQQNAKERLKGLKEYSARRREWYQDLNIRIADKQSEHLISISSISAAIIALTLAFQMQKNFWIELSFWALLVTVVLGTTLALLLIFYNKKASNYTRKIELDTIDTLKNSTNDVIQSPTMYAEHKKDFASEMKKIENLPDAYSFERKILEYLYYFILIAFILGIVGLVGAWIAKNSITYETLLILKRNHKYANIENVNYMNNIVIVVIIFSVSLALAFIKYGSLASSYRDKSWQLKFLEIWNCFWNFFIAGLIGYYFILVRLPLLLKGAILNLSDFALLIFFMISLFGHLPVLSKNITEGIQAILKKVLESK